MDFGENIKQIRNNANLTQSEFAEKLSVTRQAVSNWENNKNLPDISMLIAISDIFDVSLDKLIKGDKEMNNITKKLIDDTSETKKAKYNMICTVIASALLFLGIFCILIKGASVEYIDEQGILRENFFLLPIGFGLMLCGILTFISVGIKNIISKIAKKINENKDSEFSKK